MPSPAPAPAKANGPTLLGRWPLLGSIALVGLVAAVLVANTTHDRLFHRHPPVEAAGSPKPAEEALPPGTVTLPEAKISAINVRLEEARGASLPREVAVAGRIESTDQKVDIQPRVSGIVRSVAASLGDPVRKGQLLVTLDSPDVGSARLNVRACQRELAIARTDAEWKTTVAANVQELVKALRKSAQAATLERQFAGKPLGSRRAELMATYADMEIAAHEASQKTDLHNKNLIGEHPVALAQHTYEGAQAKFEAMMEQVGYDASQQKRLADQQVQRAGAAVIDAAQRLRILGVAEDAADPPAAPTPAEEDVTAYPIFAPFDGTITMRHAVASQRAEPVDALFTLVDLSTVRAVANVPESDFPALPELKGGTLRMTVASYPGRTFDGKVIYVAPEIDPTTRTTRLIAEIANSDGGLRPGMFARIVLDGRATLAATTVPASAVVEMDGKPGVFVPGKDARAFRFRPVTLGRESGGRRAIAAGLKAGDRVVVAGAFALKSELVLQNSPEED